MKNTTRLIDLETSRRWADAYDFHFALARDNGAPNAPPHASEVIAPNLGGIYNLDEFFPQRMSRFSSGTKALEYVREEVETRFRFRCLHMRRYEDKYLILACHCSGVPPRRVVNISRSKKIDCQFKRTIRPDMPAPPHSYDFVACSLEFSNLAHNHPLDGSSVLIRGSDVNATIRQYLLHGHPLTEVARLTQEKIARLSYSNGMGLAALGRRIIRIRFSSNLVGRVVEMNVGQSIPVMLIRCRVLFELQERKRDNRLRGFGFILPHARDLARRYPDVFAASTTLIANLQHYKVMFIVGKIATGKPFIAATYFIQDEKIPTYTWAFQSFTRLVGFEPKILVTDSHTAMQTAARRTWPNCYLILCRFHVHHAIARHSRHFRLTEFFDEDELVPAWKRLGTAYSKQEFRDACRAIKNIVGGFDVPPENVATTPLELFAKYIAQRLLWAGKMFLGASVDRHMHYDTTTISCCESMNDAFKNSFRDHATISLDFAVFKAIMLQDKALNDTISDVHDEVEKMKEEIKPNEQDSDVMRRARTRMSEANFLPSEKAWKYLKVQIEKSTQVSVTREKKADDLSDPQCNRDCQPYYSLPCAHYVKWYIMDNPAPVLDFPTQWNFVDALGGIIEHEYQSNLAYTCTDSQELVPFQDIKPPAQPRRLINVGAVRNRNIARAQANINEENQDVEELREGAAENHQQNHAVQEDPLGDESEDVMTDH